MTKAYLTGPRGIMLANGARMQHGQIIGGNPMQKNPQRPLNSASPMKTLNVGTLPAAPQRPAPGGEYNIARHGAPKNIADALPVPGQRSRIGASHAAYTGPGQATLDDEPNLPLKDHAKAIPLHPSTTPKQRAAVHPVANDPNAILQDAANVGR